MSDPDGPDEQGEPSPPAVRKEPFLFQLLRTAIAPPVLDDGGHDAPLSARGRILFWATVGILAGGIAVVLVLTLAK